MNLAPEAGVSQGMVDVDMKVSLPLITACRPACTCNPSVYGLHEA